MSNTTTTPPTKTLEELMRSPQRPSPKPFVPTPLYLPEKNTLTEEEKRKHKQEYYKILESLGVKTHIMEEGKDYKTVWSCSEEECDCGDNQDCSEECICRRDLEDKGRKDPVTKFVFSSW